MASRGANLIGAPDRDKTVEVLRSCTVDLVLLDMDVPAGLKICRAVRGCWDVPIIIVAACESDQDKVEALDGGADDFLAKPYSIDVLIARMCAMWRRTGIALRQTSGRGLVRLPCGHYQTADEIIRLAEQISMSRREAAGAALKPGEGRPRKMAMCRECGESGGTLEMRSHKCAGPGAR